MITSTLITCHTSFLAWLRRRNGSRSAWGKRLHKDVSNYLRYCRDHRDKLSKEPRPKRVQDQVQVVESTTLLVAHGHTPRLDTDTQTIMSKPTSSLAPTTASTMIEAKVQSIEEVEELFDDNQSQSSYATSIGKYGDDSRMAVIRLDSVSQTGLPFECPYCWQIQRIGNQRAWK
jgi:hypothetical protein